MHVELVHGGVGLAQEAVGAVQTGVGHGVEVHTDLQERFIMAILDQCLRYQYLCQRHVQLFLSHLKGVLKLCAQLLHSRKVPEKIHILQKMESGTVFSKTYI